MVKLQPTFIDVDERERRAGHFFRVYLKRGGDAFGENRFACAERTVEQDDLAARQMRACARAQLECLSGILGSPMSCRNNGRRVRRRHGCSPWASSAQMAALRLSLMSEATSVRIPLCFAAMSPASPPT